MMRLLLDADLPRSAGDTVRRHGREATDVRDVGLTRRERRDHRTLRAEREPVPLDGGSGFCGHSYLSTFTIFGYCRLERAP